MSQTKSIMKKGLVNFKSCFWKSLNLSIRFEHLFELINQSDIENPGVSDALEKINVL